MLNDSHIYNHIPHYRNNPKLLFERSDLVFLDERDDQKSRSTCSIVVRLAPSVVNSQQLPLRFEKRSRVFNGVRDPQVFHEDQIFGIMEQNNISIAKITQRLQMVHDRVGGDHVLITENMGIDAGQWSTVSLSLKKTNREYDHVFCHPLAFLSFIRGTLLALYEIHKIGLFHCDLRQDQVCIPFKKQGGNIKLDFHDIALIDFGIAIWEKVPVVNWNPVRFHSGNMEKGNYAADVLIDAGDYQKNIYKNTGCFDFNALLTQIDCAVDLYSLGFMLTKFEITQYSEDRQAWGSFQIEYNAWIDELLSLSKKKTPFQKNLPHQNYINKVDIWIANVTEILGYEASNLSFELQKYRTTPPVEASPVPMSLDKQFKRQEQNRHIVESIEIPNSSNKIGTVLIIVLIFLLFTLVLLPIVRLDNVTSILQQEDVTKKPPLSIPLPKPLNAHYVLTTNTVQDTNSGLVWRYCPVGRSGATGKCVGETAHLDYQGMIAAIDELNSQNNTLNIKGKWRLPTLKEIETIKLCDKTMTDLKISGKSTKVSYECKFSTSAKSIDFFDNIAFSHLDTPIWSSDKVSKTDMTLFSNKDDGYWTVNLSSGAIAKTTPDEKMAALLILDINK